MKKLHGTGITSDAAYVTGLASIGLSIVLFASGKKRTDDGRRERTAIFVGLWAPTFFIIGSALTTLEN